MTITITLYNHYIKIQKGEYMMIEVNACRIDDHPGAKCYYAKLNWKGVDGKKYQQMRSTKISLKGNNKRKADSVVEELRKEKEEELNKAPEPEKHLFMSFMEYWLSVKRRTIRESTIDSYTTCIGCMKPYFNERGITLEDLRAEDIQGFYNSLLDKGRTANTVKHYHANISNALKLALRQKMIAYNPLSGVIIPKIENVTKKSFTAEQLKAILDYVENDIIRTGVYLSAYGGLRRSEVCGLTWDCVDFEKKLIHIRQTRTKVKREIFEQKTKSKTSKRVIPLNEILENVLIIEKKKQKRNAELLKSAYENNHNFVCRYENGRKLRCDYLSRHFELVLKNLNLIGYSFHCLRHTVGSLMVNSGAVGVTAVRDYLGHSDVRTTNLYLHADAEEKKKALNVFSDIISQS